MSLILSHTAKGGVGSTFVTAQLALAFARTGRKVTAIDFTYQDALKLHFGLLPKQPAPSLAASSSARLVVSGVELVNAYSERCDGPLLERIRSEGLPLSRDQIVIVDIAAGDRDLFELLYPFADLHLAVLLPEPASLASLTRLNGDRPIPQLEKTVLVLNQLDERRKLSRHSHRFVQELFGDQVIGTIRRDEAVGEALAMFEELPKVSPHSVATPDLQALADAVLARCAASPAASANPEDPVLRRAG